MLKLLSREKMSVFLVIWLGQLISILGSIITNFALDIWIYQQTSSVTQLSFLILFSSLPLVIISPFAGVIVDHGNRRWIMILCDFGSALSTLTIAILFFIGTIQIWHIYLASALISSFAAFHIPAYNAATTLLVPKQHLGRASGMNHLAIATGQLFAPILGGVFLGLIKLSGIFLLDLSSFIFAFITLLLVRFPNYKVTQKPNLNKNSLLTQTFYGFHYLRVRPGLMALLLLFTTNNFLIGIVQVLMYPLVLSFASQSQLGTIMSFGGVGMLIGSIVMSTLGNEQKKYINILFICMPLWGFSIILAGLYPSVYICAIAAFLFFLGLPFINTCSTVIFQKKVAPDSQGRVFAFKNAISISCLPIAYPLAGLLADKVFEPLMKINSPLVGTIGQVIGTGPGRGIGFMFTILGGLIILISFIAYQYAPLRLVEHTLPDAF